MFLQVIAFATYLILSVNSCSIPTSPYSEISITESRDREKKQTGIDVNPHGSHKPSIWADVVFRRWLQQFTILEKWYLGQNKYNNASFLSMCCVSNFDATLFPKHVLPLSWQKLRYVAHEKTTPVSLRPKDAANVKCFCKRMAAN